MSRNAYLTPENAPVGTVRFCIYVPNDDMFIWNFQGALSAFAEAWNWENALNGISEEAAAAAWESANELNLPLVECPE